MTTPRPSAGFVSVLGALALTTSLVGCPGDPAAEELDSAMFERGSSGTVQVLEALAVGDALFAYDPTLDPAMSAEANAMAIASHVQGEAMGCASASVSGSSVTVTFASGCVLRTGLTAAGAVTVEVARTDAMLDVMLSFDALVVGTHALDGTAEFTTANGSTLRVVLDLAGSAGAAQTDLTVTGTAGAMEISGSATTTRDGTTTMLGFSGVVWQLGDCYPSAGTVSVTTGRITQTVTFTSATPSTGTVSITQGRVTRDATLPAYGTCPMGA